jgi:chromosome segregation ATPase
MNWMRRAEEAESQLATAKEIVELAESQLATAKEIVELADSRLTSLGRELGKCATYEREERARANREQARAEKAEAELAAARAEHYTALEQRDTAMADFIKADDELARQKPVIEAAIALRDCPDDMQSVLDEVQHVIDAVDAYRIEGDR